MTVHLTNGSHEKRADGMCAMEAAAYIAGERHSDHPVCVSSVITEFMMRWNDGLPTDAERDRLLKPLLPLVLHTRTSEADEETRAWLATDWLVRVHAATWLERGGLKDHAERLRALPPFTSSEITLAAQQTLSAAAAAAGATAWDAAKDAAWDAAKAAARDAAGAAAAAGATAVAGATAWAAAGAATWAAATAGDAAGAALAPTVLVLQASAQDLVRRMCAVGEVTERPMRSERLAEVLT